MSHKIHFMLPLWDFRRGQFQPVFTSLLIALTAWLYVAQQYYPQLAHRYALKRWAPELIDAVAYVFFHNGLEHLLGNLWLLWLFGGAVESFFAQRRHLEYVAFYLAGAAASSLAYLCFDVHEGLLIGASGAVSAMLGMYVRLWGRQHMLVLLGVIPVRIQARLLGWFWLLLQVGHWLDGATHIAYLVHLAGYGFGYLYGSWRIVAWRFPTPLPEPLITWPWWKAQGSDPDQLIYE